MLLAHDDVHASSVHVLWPRLVPLQSPSPSDFGPSPLVDNLQIKNN
jgi:hypothetical protein